MSALATANTPTATAILVTRAPSLGITPLSTNSLSRSGVATVKTASMMRAKK